MNPHHTPVRHTETMIELGLDTFGDVVFDSERPPCLAGAGAAECRDRRRARRGGWRRCVRRGRASSSRLCRVGAGSGAVSHCRQDRADSSRFGGDGAQHRRSDPGVSAILDAQRSVERARRSDPRQGILHGVVSAVRLRSLEIQRAVRREAGCRFVKLSRPAAHCLSADRKRPPAHVGRRRRQPEVGGARGALWTSADARHHRRQREALSVVRGLVQAGVEGVRKRCPAHRRALARPHCGNR